MRGLKANFGLGRRDAFMFVGCDTGVIGLNDLVKERVGGLSAATNLAVFGFVVVFFLVLLGGGRLGGAGLNSALRARWPYTDGSSFGAGVQRVVVGSLGSWDAVRCHLGGAATSSGLAGCGVRCAVGCGWKSRGKQSTIGGGLWTRRERAPCRRSPIQRLKRWIDSELVGAGRREG